jgi:hypothetical protein
LPGIDPFGDGLNNVGAAAGPIASQPIGVLRIEPMQDAGVSEAILSTRADAIVAADRDGIIRFWNPVRHIYSVIRTARPCLARSTSLFLSGCVSGIGTDTGG